LAVGIRMRLQGKSGALLGSGIEEERTLRLDSTTICLRAPV
jgi:hypothetical protein